MSLRLYNLNNSTCSQKVRLTLAEKKLDFEEIQVNLKENEQYQEWYLKLNPNGVVPTLIHDGNPVIDSTVICEYLDDVFPSPPLSPASAIERARMRAWRQYTDEVSTPAVRIPSFNAYIVPSWGNEQWMEDRKAKSPLRKAQFARLRPTGYPPEDVFEAMTKLAQCISRMETALASGPWMLGRQYTIADVLLTPSIVRLHDLGLQFLFNDADRVKDWYQRIQQRPSFSKAYYPGSRMPAARHLEREIEAFHAAPKTRDVV
ncbi:MAG: glutathione S-transferase family protein [Proteobacteria bacterium]|nr:glutathione S-transferase family protein [Pseudomonadota bacterium]